MTSTRTSFELTSAQQWYLETFMNKVSRSFAVVVSCLEEPLNHVMATAYLLCRVVDNIEDCQRPVAWKLLRFNEFSQLLRAPALAADILTVWESESWPGLTPDERQLMSLEDGLTLWRIYALVPEEDRSVIRHWVQAMAQGMAQVEEPGQPPRSVIHNGIRVLADEHDYNRYCYVVAGTVGHMATELVINHYRLPSKTAIYLQVLCEACGRSLQKTNIIKDFAEDLKRRVCYLPETWLREADYAPLQLAGAAPTWKQKVLSDVLAELEEANDYILSLPYRAAGYRLASLMCLLPAYQTILLAARQQERMFTTDHNIKISRPTLAGCMQAAQAMVADNSAIYRYHQQIKYEVEAAFTTPVGRGAMYNPKERDNSPKSGNNRTGDPASPTFRPGATWR